MNHPSDDPATCCPVCVGDGYLSEEGVEKSKADARALWADAVLDTWADSVRDEQRGHFSYQIDGRYVCAVKSGGYGHCGQYSGDSAPAARLAAAKKLYPDLPESVRRELGECP